MKAIKYIFTLFFFIYIVNIINCLQRPPLFKCEHKVEEEKDVPPNIVVELSNKEKEDYKRRISGETDSDGFKDFNIYVDLVNIKEDIKKNNLQNYENLFISSINKVVSTLQSLLKVRPLENAYQISTSFLNYYNIEKYNESMFGDVADQNNINFKTLGIDLAIFGLIDDLGNSTLATASAKENQKTNGQPYVGILKINKNVDYSKPKSQEYFQAILIHEFTHILGFSKDFFTTKNMIETKQDANGVNRMYLKGEKLLTIAKKYYNCDSIEGIELENQGGSGTAGSHWEARILLGEYMNGYAYTEEQVISEFTLAVLEDLGYYKANYYTGGLMRYGKHKGCGFLQNSCINKITQELYDESFENEFYDHINSILIDPSCSSGRQSRTYNAFYSNPYIPNEFDYFNNSNITGYEPADFCPVPLSYCEEEENRYYVGHCSEKGSLTDYGTLLAFNDNNSRKYIGQKLSSSSFCFLSSLSKNEVVSKEVRANCYEVFCSETYLTLHIFQDYIVCPRSGGKIKVDGYEGYLLCPDYNLICSGTVLCNDMFDCVDKKSEVKETSYIYEYNIKTSQDIKKAMTESEVTEDYYEEDQNGICPINCKHCKEKKKCQKCRNDYALKYDNNQVICDELKNLEKGYFLDKSNIYTKCIDNCEICKDKNTCDECSDGYYYNVKQCKLFENGRTPIENCHEYDGQGNCVKCRPGYAFKENDKEKCLDIETEFNGYYSENGISYYPCSKKNENWTDCYYNQTEYRVKGILCIEGQIMVQKGVGVCYTEEDFFNNTKLYRINDTHGGICSRAIPNCLECDSATNCITCKINYEYDNEKNECVVKTKKQSDDEDGGDNTSSSDSDKSSTTSTRRKRKVKKSDLVNSNDPWIFTNFNIIKTLYLLFLLIL